MFIVGVDINDTDPRLERGYDFVEERRQMRNSTTNAQRLPVF